MNEAAGLITLANDWASHHAMVLGLGTWLLGWFIPSPWAFLLDKIDEIAIFLLKKAKERLLKSGASKEQIRAWELKLKEALDHIEADIDKDLRADDPAAKIESTGGIQ